MEEIIYTCISIIAVLAIGAALVAFFDDTDYMGGTGEL
jgi:hypothetical protein